MRKQLFFTLTGLLSLIALTSYYYFHRLQPYQTERFFLSAAPAAADGYPMEVVEGDFLTSEGSGFTVSSGFLEGDWGLSHIAYGSTTLNQPAPERLAVRWFSYTEDKFYEGDWLLPQQRIHALLKQGYWNTDRQEHDTYSSLTVCFLPKGVAVVWLSGQNQVLLGRYEGKEINFDFKRFNEAANRPRMIQQEQAKLPPAVQQQIHTGSLSTKKWDTYLQAYPWKVAFSQPLKLYNYGISYFNAEETAYPPTRGAPSYNKVLLEPNAKPIASNMYMQVEANYGRKRLIMIRAFDENEIIGAFQKLHAADPTLPLTLYFDTDERVSKVRLLLKNDRQQVELTKAKVELYDAE